MGFIKFVIWVFFFFFFFNYWGNWSFIEIRQEQPVLYVKTDIHIWSYLAQFFLEWEMLQTKVVQKIKTHILCSITLFFFYAFFEIMWKIMVEWGRPQVTVWFLHIACCIPKATHTHSEYVILFVFPLQQWLQEHASVLRYTYTVSSFFFFFCFVLIFSLLTYWMCTWNEINYKMSCWKLKYTQ
jgi:hypothetical protein